MPQRRGQNTRIKVIGGQVTFSFTDTQFVEWRRSLEHFGDAAKNWSPVFSRFARYYERSIERNFAAEGRPTPWPELAPSTIEDRLRQGYGPGPILTRSGNMRRGFVFDWGPKSFRVSNRKWYWIIHQLGGEKIPQRAMVVLQPQDKAVFTRFARDHFLGRR